MKIAIAGATGFIGGLLLERLPAQHEVIALARTVPHPSPVHGVVWRSCDLFSLLQLERALEGVDVAIYLVHSMSPRARLTQSAFEDSDLLLADNFGRAARRAGVKRIIYLGGIVPDTTELSPHLASRLEVEHALSAHGIPLVSLRAGLILGANGSSFQILSTLVRRLPVLICPAWTQTPTQPISARDVIELILFCVSESGPEAGVFDIGGTEVVTYQELMRRVARALGVRRLFVGVSMFSPGLSALWVRLITGASPQLVSPLVQSLRHSMLVRADRQLNRRDGAATPLDAALAESVRSLKPALKASTRLQLTRARSKTDVRSIQRLPLPAGRDASWVADEYFRWLPRLVAPLLRLAESPRGTWSFHFAWIRRPLLVLEFAPDRSTRDRPLYYIRPGLLSRPTASGRERLEFHQIAGGREVLAAIHDFQPRLPWYIYKYTQALVHLWVMRRFRAHLARLAARPAPASLGAPKD